jgi:hypothetical protein
MDRRPQLHQHLKNLFEGEPHVYYQPPENVVLKYPCIVYKLADISEKYADNAIYMQKRQYQLTVIDRDPDSKLREALLYRLGKTFTGRFERPFVTEGLHHYVFRIYY